MKKTFHAPKRKLTLDQQTIRALTQPALGKVAGGQIYRWPNHDATYAEGCTWGNGSVCDVATGYMCPDPK